jgi:serine/threonine protein kinase
MIGRTISHYRVVSKLGAGGMGDVYVAEDTRLDRKVAIKVLPAEFTRNAENVSRFIQEAKAASALNHPISLLCMMSAKAARVVSS